MPHWPEADLALRCYPEVPANISMPWDAADGYMLNESDAPVRLILNDRYGALSCAFPEAQVWHDSFCARIATQQNRLENGLPEATFLEHPDFSDADHPDNVNVRDSLVLIRIPKQKEQLSAQLYYLAKVYPDATVLLAGMAKHIPIPLLNWLEEKAEHYEQLPVVRKARLVRIRGLSKFSDVAPVTRRYDISGFSLSAPAGVFCSDRPDPGARALLKHLPTGQTGTICDLGCGNGILSAHIAKSNPQATLIATDDSQLATLAARSNLQTNNLRGDVRQGNILSSVEETLDMVICNPPFHDGHKQLTSIAESMFHESFHQLRQGGELLVVANRHLPYTKVLKRLFKDVALVSDDKRFNIYRCVR